MSFPPKRWRLYDRRGASFQLIEADHVTNEDGAYVFRDVEGKELVRYPMSEHGGLVSVGWLKDTGRQ